MADRVVTPAPGRMSAKGALPHVEDEVEHLYGLLLRACDALLTHDPLAVLRILREAERVRWVAAGLAKVVATSG